MKHATTTLSLLLFSVATLQTFACSASCPRVQDPNGQLVVNGTFDDWSDKLPAGWTVEVGSTTGENPPLSRLKPGPGPSLELSGNARTRAWQSVSQTIDVQPGKTIQFSYSAKAVGVKREGPQLNNCYIGLFPISTTRQKLKPTIWTIESKKFKTESHTYEIRSDVDKVEITIFLSKTGKLAIKDIVMVPSEIEPESSFDMLVEEMGRNYSFFDHKKFDWPAHTDRYRDRAMDAESPEEFSKVIGEMLDALKDTHISTKLDGKHYGSFSSRTSPKHNFEFVDEDLKKSARFGQLGTVGITNDGFGYARFNSLANISDDDLKAMETEMASRLDSPGFIIDLRENGGGNEEIAKVFARMFTDKELVYAKSVHRNGDEPDDFSQPQPRVLTPKNGGESFTGPVICLIGPNAVSSAEGFAMMMKATPNCTLVGQPTRGASGNPAPVHLPNGVDVWFSRWKSLLPDGTCIEGVGVKPDVEIVTDPNSDAAYGAAIMALTKMLEDK